jgi:hypothetical protein
MEQLARIVEAIWSDEIARLFCTAIAGWFALALLFTVFGNNARGNVGGEFVRITPNSLATIGILGTFTGILIGLLDFDVTRIDDSVPGLLAGLKVAFTTSIAGITAAIAFRLVTSLMPGPAAEEGATAEAILDELVRIRAETAAAAARSAELVAELRRARSMELAVPWTGDTEVASGAGAAREPVE